MLLKGDEGGAKFGGGSVTSNRDSSLTTRRSIHSAIHEPGRRPTRTRAAKFPGSAAAAAMPFFGQQPAGCVPRSPQLDEGGLRGSLPPWVILGGGVIIP